jgi:hypothetical protein
MARIPFASARPFRMALTALVLAGFAACGGGPNGPKTYPVKGAVVFVKGGSLKQLVDGTVEFQSVSEPGVRAYGEIQQDGSFSLTTLKDGKASPGAIEGEHRARVVPPQEREGKPVIDPQFLSFEKSGLTFRVPGSEDITIQVWRSR